MGVCSAFSLKLNRGLKFTPELVLINFDSITTNPFKTIKLINKQFGIPPKYIALTTCYQKAFKALKKGAVDVVDKFEKPEEIQKAIQRYHKVYLPSKLFCIQYYHNYQYLYLNDILFLKADNYTTDFILKDGNTVNGFETLKQSHLQLPYNFQRVHRSYVINSYYVRRIDYGKKEIKLCHIERPIPISKTYIQNVAKVKQILTQGENPCFV